MATFTGTNSGETINGSNTDDTINGLGGNDILFGDAGLDILNGGNGNDRFDITAQSQIVAGETYNGGLGVDTLYLNTGSAIDLSSTIINADVEQLIGFGAVSLTASQLGNFAYVQTGAITLTNAGTVDLAGAKVYTTVFNLNSAGNTITLAGVSDTTYTINGGNGNDTITGGDSTSGDALNGGEGDDAINGGLGNDTLTGGGGSDDVDGGGGDDRMVVTAQAELALSGESFIGGSGFDRLDLETGNPIDLSLVSIAADIEYLESNGVVSLTATQLGNFQQLSTGLITVTTAGTADLTGATVYTNSFQLSNSGNVFTLAGVTTLGGYTVAGGNGIDNITGSDASFGDNLSGGGGNDTLNGAIGNDTLTGGEGKDVVNGGQGDDRMVIVAQTDIVAAETYTGGDGFDRLDLETGSPMDISSLTINADIEYLESNGAVSLKAAQLGNFKQVSTGAITLTSAGAANMAGDTIYTNTFNLFANGNNISLAGNATNVYTVNGGNGNDNITGGDYVSGDTLSGGGGNDIINGGGGNDAITGGAGDDTVSGGQGDDRLYVFSQTELVATDTFNGGVGFDILDLETGAPINLTAVTINADVERLESNGAVTLTALQLSNFKNIQTGTITLSNGGNVNMSGDYVVTGTFILADVATTLTLAGVQTNTYTINGGTANDVITGGDYVPSGDVLNGGGGDDTLNGGQGNDTLTGGAGKDTVNGGQGDDRMVISLQSEIVAAESYVGGVGFDTLDLETSAAIDISSLTINADVERLESNGVVSLKGGQLTNFKNIQTGAITLTDNVAVDLANDTVYTGTFNLSAAGNTFSLAGVQTTGYTINGGAGVDTITGGDYYYGDTINGGANNDVIDGGAGNDLLIGGAGSDTINGGIGDDRIRYLAQTEIVANETISGGAGFDILDLETSAAINITSLVIAADIERLESNGAVSVRALQLGNFVNVQTGTITLSTAGVADLTDADVFTSTFILNAAGNTLNLTGATENNYTVTGGAGNDIITGGDSISGDTLNGGGGNDTINGGAGNDTITGGLNTDTINGDVGDDRIVINSQAEISGAEVINGGIGVDKLDLETVAAIDIGTLVIGADVETLESGGAVSLRAAQLDAFKTVQTGAITLINAGTIDLTDAQVFTQTFNLVAAGNTLDLTGQTLTGYIVNGGAGVDTILGGDQADLIIGGGGNDQLTGGGLADQFRYTSVAAGTDTIIDFSGQTAFGGGTGDGDRFAFVGLLTGTFDYIEDASFSAAGDSQARFAGANSLQVDTNGDGVVDISIVVQGLTAPTQLVNADFLWS